MPCKAFLEAASRATVLSSAPERRQGTRHQALVSRQARQVNNGALLVQTFGYGYSTLLTCTFNRSCKESGSRTRSRKHTTFSNGRHGNHGRRRYFRRFLILRFVLVRNPELVVISQATAAFSLAVPACHELNVACCNSIKAYSFLRQIQAEPSTAANTHLPYDIFKPVQVAITLLLLLQHSHMKAALLSMIQSHAPLFVAAFGAVAIAAVGVWGVFKMAMAVAEGTGRTLNSHGPSIPAPAASSQSAANDLLPMQPDVPSGPVYPPNPAARKVKLEA